MNINTLEANYLMFIDQETYSKYYLKRNLKIDASKHYELFKVYGMV